MITFFSNLSREVKSSLILLVDSMLIILSLYLAFCLRLNLVWSINWLQQSWVLLILVPAVGIVASILLRIHKVKISAFEGTAQLRLSVWTIIVTLVATFSNLFFSLGAPRTVPIVMGLLLFVFAVGLRYLAAHALTLSKEKNLLSNREPVAIYGAGSSGMQLISSLKNSLEYRPSILIDDNRSLHGVIMGGLTVTSPKDLKRKISKRNINKVFLAIPSLSLSYKKEILKELINIGCEVKELPTYTELLQVGDLISGLKTVSPDQLLGRDGVNIDVPEIESAYAGKSVLVSGAGGSIGAELCRKIIDARARRLILYEMSELALYNIEMELREKALLKNIELVPVLGSVLDKIRVEDTLKTYNIELVLHAAAYKHVPLLEINEIEAGRINILGTEVIANASSNNNVERFIFVSTDKAVRPTNVMGASKRLAELVIQNLNENSNKTIFSIVRFGNVLGSSGSVIPQFKKQIEYGGPITLTHHQVTRYFMTIPEAAKLVLLAGSFAEGGEVFVLDMGEPVKIGDLAKQMIKLSGLQVLSDENPDGDIAIEVTGLRPGEKLYEELLIGSNTLPTPHAKIMRAQEVMINNDQLCRALEEVKRSVEANSEDDLRKTLLDNVTGYKVVKLT